MIDSQVGERDAVQNGTRATAAVLSEPNADFSLEEVTVQEPRDDEVLVRVIASGVCHTDLVCKGSFPVPLPIVLGHEGSGVVEAVGPAVKNVAVGDHVVLTFNSCGACRNCANGHSAYCYAFVERNFGGTRADGSTPMHGHAGSINAQFFGQSSFAGYAIAREVNTVVVSKSAPLENLGPLGCAIQTGAGAILKSLEVKKGDTVAIFGGGAVGLSAVMAANIAGATAIILSEPIAERRALALELGATAVVDPTAEEDVIAAVRALAGGGLTHALDTTGIPAVLGAAVEMLLPYGILGYLGFSSPQATLPANIMSMLVRGVRLKAIIEGDSNPHEFIPKLVEYHEQGKLPFDRLLSRYAFDDINAAFRDVAGGVAIKPLLIMS